MPGLSPVWLPVYVCIMSKTMLLDACLIDDAESTFKSSALPTLAASAANATKESPILINAAVVTTVGSKSAKIWTRETRSDEVLGNACVLGLSP